MYINPHTLHKNIKKNIINANIFVLTSGRFFKLPKPISQYNKLIENCDPGIIDKICDVTVVNEHSIDAIDSLRNTLPNFNPVIINLVGSDFNGSSSQMTSMTGIRDENIMLRTTFCMSIPIRITLNPYPIKNPDCIYTTNILVIRPPKPDTIYEPKNIFKISLISTSPINKPILSADNEMNSTDLITTCSIIECIFQSAIGHKHNILVLPPFGHNIDDNPISDIILIYNNYIMKYSHKFDKIIIAIPPWYPPEIFKLYNDNIIKPQQIAFDIDSTYDSTKLKDIISNSNKQVVNNTNS